MRKTNGANILHTHDDIELVLRKLDDLEKQNKDLADQNKQMQAEIQSLKKGRDENEVQKFKDWLEKRKEK